jgi:predicted nucleic acid-binding Zn ribbon protein
LNINTYEVAFVAKTETGIKEHPKPPKQGGKGAKLLQHRHCQVCYKAIPLSEEFCSEECSLEFDKMVKKRKNLIYVIYGTMVVMIIILLLSM